MAGRSIDGTHLGAVNIAFITTRRVQRPVGLWTEGLRPVDLWTTKLRAVGLWTVGLWTVCWLRGDEHRDGPCPVPEGAHGGRGASRAGDVRVVLVTAG